MNATIEYRDVTDGQVSRSTVLDQATHNGRTYLLRHHSAGYESAGSMARWTNEKWSVSRPGAFGGSAFLTEQEARDTFVCWTQ